jgi:ribosome-associated translation inhibitor RaiA
MKKNFKFTDTEPDALLQAYAEKKIDSFTKLLTDEEADAAICYTEFRRSTRHQKGKVCTAEITLEVTGKVYRVTKDEPTFKKAIDKVKDDILASIREDKGKGKKSVRTGARKAKSMIQKALV